MPQATIEGLAARLPNLSLCNACGSTETLSPVTILPIGIITGHADTVDKVLPLSHILVVDEALREVPPGESGQLLVVGPIVVPGYWNNPEGHAKGFTMGCRVSGEIGSKDAEGHVRDFDRKQDKIIRGGFKVYCIKVKNAVKHHPAAVEVAVAAGPSCPRRAGPRFPSDRRAGDHGS